VAVGIDALTSTTTGGENTAVGNNAGNSVTTGEKNILIGRFAGADQVTTADAQLYIARSNDGAGNATTYIYGNSNGELIQGSNNSHWATTSDQRLKKDIVDNTVGLSIINQIKIRNFKYKQYSDGSPVTSDDTVDMSEFPNAEGVHQVLIGQGNTSTKLGVIAQELESVAPNCVTTNERGVKTVDDDEIFWYMLNAIKELSAKVTALEAG